MSTHVAHAHIYNSTTPDFRYILQKQYCLPHEIFFKYLYSLVFVFFLCVYVCLYNYACVIVCQCTCKWICTHNPLRVHLCLLEKSPSVSQLGNYFKGAMQDELHVTISRICPCERGQDTLSSLLCWCCFLTLINRPLIAATDHCPSTQSCIVATIIAC